ncbi:peptidase, M16 family protein [Enhygromyxa salina]|uniref:Peptidase, M16 family protein n=1 Tax=Enhygromyxa salina TaxID=215803 RepID=A0A0C1ZGJ5_9BACT|nr:pitrilysin family protein [Enhygromyxa salina]KIG16724.1 peptidase, M16 family protein [Enhygromyxa salina]
MKSQFTTRAGRRLVTSAALLMSMTVSMSACEREATTVDPDTTTVDVVVEDPAPRWPDEPFRAERPTPKPIKNVTIPKVETFELDNGVEVFLVQQQTLPTVLMYMEWDLGEVNDPKGKAGMSALCGSLVGEATKNKDKEAFAAAQDDHAVSVGLRAGTELTNLSLRALERELGPALDLAAEMLFEPGMRQTDFDRLKDQRKAWIEQSKGSASSISRRIFPSLIWGSKHTYAKIETAASLDKVTLSDCESWVKRLKPDGARLWVVGKITEAELRTQFDARFGNWKGKAPKPVKLGTPKPAKATIFFVHVPNSAQSEVLIGHPGPARDLPDFEATQLMAMILGGSFSSRINMNLREDKGWSYGARGGFSYNRGGSSFAASSSVRSDVTGPAVLEIAKEIERMRSAAPTAEELRREQEGALLAMPAEFATATRTLFSMRELDYFSLPLDWHGGHQERLRAVDTAAIHAAAQAHLQASDQVVLVVGDGAVVLESLEKIAEDAVFGGGGIQYLDSDGNPITRPDFAQPDPSQPDQPDPK